MAKLTDTEIKNVKMRSTPFRLFDGEGLHLMVRPTGHKSWRFKYRIGTKQKEVVLGQYPMTSLSDARKKRFLAQQQLEAGDDPATLKQNAKLAQKIAASGANLFKVFAQNWFDKAHKTKSESTKVRNQRILKYLMAKLGNVELSKITRKAVKSAVSQIEKENGGETAHRALRIATNIFEDAATDDLIQIDPCYGIKATLAPVIPRHRSALTKPNEVGQMLRDIWGYHGNASTVAALKLLALTFTRPGELRQARWEEFDFEKKLWVLPVERTKKKKQEHLIPLSKQSVKILKDHQKLELSDELVFPTARPGRPLSENGFSVALQTMGYSGETHQPHGFRSTASTLLHEMNYPVELIETQLDHSRPGVHGIYNRSHLLPQRKEMMQTWADYLDSLRNGEYKIVPIQAAS